MQGGDGHRHAKTGPVPADLGRSPCRGQLDFRPLASRAVWEERSAGFVPVATRSGRQGWALAAPLSPEPVFLCMGGQSRCPRLGFCRLACGRGFAGGGVCW